MERPRWTSFIMLSTVLSLVIQLLIINSVIAQGQNTLSVENRSALRIVDLKNNTITILDPETFQPISVRNLTPEEVANVTAFLTPENTTTDDTITTDTGNATTDDTITMDTGSTTINETLATDTDNVTTNVNLTDKFDALQGK